jgi:hypothetical protein
MPTIAEMTEITVEAGGAFDTRVIVEQPMVDVTTR